jgi:hypothetical protein
MDPRLRITVQNLVLQLIDTNDAQMVLE